MIKKRFMEKRKTQSKILSLLLAVTMVGTSLLNPIVKQTVSATSTGAYFSTNETGYGKNKTIQIDGSFSDWSKDMLIAQGVANDDSRAFRGTHEGPVYDTYALYGAWDNDNLYVMWEFTNVTDVVDPVQGYPISDNGKPYNGDIPQILAFDLDQTRSADGTISGTTDSIWGIDVNYANGVDAVAMFSSKPGVGTPALFTMDSTGAFNYEEEYCSGFKTLGIQYKYGDGNISDHIYGLNNIGYDYNRLYDSSTSLVDFKQLGHSDSQDTMYEMSIPLSALGITKDYIENNGIGVMHISTFGASGIASIPADMSMYDMANMPYSADDSTSAEKEDKDILTADLARIGSANGNTESNNGNGGDNGNGSNTGEENPGTENPGTENPGTETPEPGDEDYIELNPNQPSEGSANDGPTENMEDGAILHAWCWSFNTIKNNMQAISDAGYTSVQTSPVNQCVIGNGGDMKFTEQWWYHYQPTDYIIGNYQLGTEAEFEAMCDKAEEYGIKIIVDVVANHCTSDYSKIAQTIKNKYNFFHTNVSIGDNEWNDRYKITQKALLGLWDNNTQNTVVQEYIKDFLVDCVELGADGFRYDAAKHIELPDDSNYGGDFWPNVLDNGSEFQYGEILQDSSTSREGAYANYMSVTASNYGINLRNNMKNNNFSTSAIVNWNINVAGDKMVTWVESHDNYANGIHDWGSSQWMNDEQIKLSWAAIAARKDGTPLFFSRPVGGGGRGEGVDNRFPELTRMGDRGSDLFMDDEVAAVNKFRNAMVGEGEYLRNPNSSSQILMIERGTKGAVIINLNYSSTSISSTTKLANGTYTNRTDDNSVFNVNNGTITGTLPARSVVVLYKNGNSVSVPSVSIAQASQSFKTDTLDLTLQCSTDAVKATYCINGGTSYVYTNGTVLTIGANDAIGTVYEIELRAINSSGYTTSKTYRYEKADPSVATGFQITFTKPSGWGSNINAYIYDESGSTVKVVEAWPGVAMTNMGNGTYQYTMSEVFEDGRVIFNDGNNQAPGSMLPGYVLTEPGNYNQNGLITDGTTVYFSKPSGWGSTIYAYVYDESGSTVKQVAAWPGVVMSQDSGSGYYTYKFDIDYSDPRIIFSDGNNQVPAMNQTGYSVVNNGVYNSSGLSSTYAAVFATSASTTTAEVVSFQQRTNYVLPTWGREFMEQIAA